MPDGNPVIWKINIYYLLKLKVELSNTLMIQLGKASFGSKKLLLNLIIQYKIGFDLKLSQLL